MNCVLIILLAFLAINSGSSSALSEISDSPSKKNYNTEELGTCPMNSSISVTLFRNLRGEWLTTFVDGNKLQNFTRSMDLNLEKNVLQCGDSRYISICGFLKDTDAANSSEVTVGEYRNKTDGEANDSFKRINELTTIAEDNANHVRKALQIMEQRMNSFEKTLNNNTETLINFENTQNNITETLINFEKTQNNITVTLINFEKTQNNITETMINFEKTQTSFQKTLTNIEQILNEMRVISNSTKNLVTEDKEKATSTLIPKSSSTHVKESVTTAPSLVVTKAKAQITFDSEIKGRQVQLSSDLRTATRTRPTESEYLGSVVSNSFLEDDQVFQIKIDETIEKWSDLGIAIGVIEEKKKWIKHAWYMLNTKGTRAIHSGSESQSGKSNIWKDGNRITENGYPLSTHNLPVGTLLGVSRRSNGDLHFYLDGVDKGAAFVNVPKDVYAFVDMIYYVTKISITN